MTTELKTIDETTRSLCDGMLFRDSTGTTFEFKRDNDGSGYAIDRRTYGPVELDSLRLPLYLFD